MQTTNQNDYNFPVSLRPVFDENGVEIPKVRLVARTDRTPITPFGVVSNRYRLILHPEMVAAMEPLLRRLRQLSGEYTVFPLLEKNGAKLMMNYTFPNSSIVLPGIRTPEDRDGTEECRVAFRIYAVNSYNGTSLMSVKVCALVARSGITLAAVHSGFDIAVKHIGVERDIELPDPDVILQAFRDSGRVWQQWANHTMTEEQIRSVVSNSQKLGLFSNRVYEKERGRFMICTTAWDFYNALAEMIGMGTRKLQESTRLARLDRLNLVMNHALNPEV